ncbi:restriction endonuclease subunit S [Oscillibacter ruminantium]|uniref:restriction endonuclease subunit S n=1 Tax=Oscillibacter ruminantium TaxID=1263547 RepID=UPI000314083A|nr:restriction endonuclease subunit S [Oscillibacter ruminantium]
MNEQIKKRIEQIRYGEVPEGYKKSKVGVVPHKWEETHFREMFSRLNRKNTEGNTNVLTISAQYGLISQGDFFNKAIASEDKSNYFLLYRGEYAYNKSYSNGYPFGALKPLEMYESGIVSPLYICFSKTARNQCPQYYTHYFEGGLMNREIKAFAQEGARNHGLLNISVDDFFNSYLLVPALPEQQKIAAILTTQDKVIELQEKLLTEKQRQKKYLCQQLLTGKKRLPGFGGEWKKVKLKKLLKERKKYAQKGAEFPHVTLSTTGIYPKSDRYDRDHLVKSEDKEYKITHFGDICYNPANLKFGVICVNTYGDAIFSPIYVTFEATATVNIDFLSNYLMRWDFINAVRKYEEGTVYERMAVKPEDFLKYEVLLPALNEQTAIAEILSTADQEISLLQKSIDTEKQKKKALMQLLLTGIVRVNT